MNDESLVLQAGKAAAPEVIDDIWNKPPLKAPSEATGCSMLHMTALTLDECYDRSDFVSLLQSRERCTQLLQKASFNCTILGMFAAQHNRQVGEVTLLGVCLGCNTLLDSGNCQHPGPRPIVKLPLRRDDIKIVLHQTTILLEVASKLATMDLTLIRSDSEHAAFDVDMLIDLAAPVLPVGVDPVKHVTNLSSRGPEHTPILLGLVGLLDECSVTFPKSAHTAAGLLSLIIARRPATALSYLDEKVYVKLFQCHLSSIFPYLHNSQCRVDERYGLVSLFNCLPALYYMVNIKNAPHLLKKHAFSASLASLICNLVCSAAGDEESDKPPNTQHFPELATLPVAIAPLFQLSAVSKKLYSKRPMTYAIVCLIEILGRWHSKNISVVDDKIPTNTAPVSVSEGLAEYRDKFDILANRSPSIRPVLSKILDSSLIEGKKPRSMGDEKRI